MHKRQITIPCTGYSIAADWYEGDNKNEILLVFVGFGSTKERNTDFVADIVAKTQMSALVVDYSGHGESPFELGRIRPAEHLLETVLAFDWLRAQYPEAKISVMGTSYGAFMAAYLTRFRSFKKLVLRTPAIYEPSDFYSPHADIDKLAVRTYRANSEAATVHPLFLQSPKFTGTTFLVIHEDDESIPKETTKVYQEVFSADTYVAKGFKHAMRDPANPREKFAEYQEAIAEWLMK
jgi:fermentation-respiration switch protein FrsA (DUF1100 family)